MFDPELALKNEVHLGVNRSCSADMIDDDYKE